MMTKEYTFPSAIKLALWINDNITDPHQQELLMWEGIRNDYTISVSLGNKITHLNQCKAGDIIKITHLDDEVSIGKVQRTPTSEDVLDKSLKFDWLIHENSTCQYDGLGYVFPCRHTIELIHRI